MIQEFLTWGKERFEGNIRRLHFRQQRWEERRIPIPRPVILTEVEKSPCAALLVVSGKKGTCRTARLLPARHVILNAVKNLGASSK